MAVKFDLFSCQIITCRILHFFRHLLSFIFYVDIFLFAVLSAILIRYNIIVGVLRVFELNSFCTIEESFKLEEKILIKYLISYKICAFINLIFQR